MQPTIYSGADNPIDRLLIDPDAITIIHRLKEAGFTAYIVGGGVRDLLLGRMPKDIDISTSAKPEEVKKVFGRRCILIGRRFRLAHIRFGNKIFEVATFRAGDMSEDFITQDNVWGTEQEDVLRRDFTINGLFYDPENHAVIDYVGGRVDLDKHILHTIGDPEIRFKQDPVRMLRLLKFQARFELKPSPDVKAALQKCLPEIVKSSSARILEEVLRMLESYAAAPFFKLMQTSGMLEILMPRLNDALNESLLQYLETADKINKQSSRYPIERPVLTAALLFPLLEKHIQNLHDEGNTPHLGEIMGMCSTFIHTYFSSAFTHFPRKISSTMVYILTTQYRFTPLNNKRSHFVRMFRMREFPLALRLLKIRAIVNPDLQQTYITWREHYRKFLRTEDHPHVHQHPANIRRDSRHATRRA